MRFPLACFLTLFLVSCENAVEEPIENTCGSNHAFWYADLTQKVPELSGICIECPGSEDATLCLAYENSRHQILGSVDFRYTPNKADHEVEPLLGCFVLAGSGEITISQGTQTYQQTLSAEPKEYRYWLGTYGGLGLAKLNVTVNSGDAYIYDLKVYRVVDAKYAVNDQIDPKFKLDIPSNYQPADTLQNGYGQSFVWTDVIWYPSNGTPNQPAYGETWYYFDYEASHKSIDDATFSSLVVGANGSSERVVDHYTFKVNRNRAIRWQVESAQKMEALYFGRDITNTSAELDPVAVVDEMEDPFWKKALRNDDAHDDAGLETYFLILLEDGSRIIWDPQVLVRSDPGPGPDLEPLR